MSSEPIAIGANLTRAAQLAEIMPDAKAERRVNLSFSSDTALLREFDFGPGWEVLGHGDGEVNLSRLATGTAPLLKDHRNDLDSKVGSVERAWIEGGKGKAVVRLAQTASGSEMLARIRAGEVGSISVGYRVESFTRDGERDGLPVMRATKWTPLEISLVAIPADASVGIGRSLTGAGKQPISSKETKMTPPPRPQRAPPHRAMTLPPSATVPPKSTRSATNSASRPTWQTTPSLRALRWISFAPPRLITSRPATRRPVLAPPSPRSIGPISPNIPSCARSAPI